MSDDEEITQKYNLPKLKDKFITMTEQFISEYLKMKKIELPDASQPIDVDKILLDIDMHFAEDK